MKSFALPRIAPIPTEKNEWVLLEEYHFVLPLQYGGQHIWIPAGARTDLASVPRLAWPLLSPFELSGLAPLLHDLYYRGKGMLPHDWYSGLADPIRLSREEADKLFLWVMEKEGVSGWRRWSAYQAVRKFGGGAWRSNSRIVVDLPLAEYLMADGEEGDLGWGEPEPIS